MIFGDTTISSMKSVLMHLLKRYMKLTLVL